MWHNHIDFQVFKTHSKRVVVLPFISDEAFGALYRSASTSVWNVDGIKGSVQVVSRIFRTFDISSSSSWRFGTLREPGGHI